MDNKEWVVVVLEQESAEINIHKALNEKDAYCKLRAIWSNDIATEVNESTRQVDFNKSFCDDNYAELWYNYGDSAIKYFANEITDYSNISETVEDETIIVLGNKLTFGTNMSEIVLYDKTGDILIKYDVTIIAIGEQFIVISDEKNGLMRVDIDDIKAIIINK